MFRDEITREKEPLRYPASGRDEVIADYIEKRIVPTPPSDSLIPLFDWYAPTRKVRVIEILEAGPSGAEGLTIDEHMAKLDSRMVDDVKLILGKGVYDATTAELSEEAGWTEELQEQQLRNMCGSNIRREEFTKETHGPDWKTINPRLH